MTPIPETSAPRIRSHALDGLRGVAAQVVFAAHLVVSFFPGSPYGLDQTLGVLARLAVIVFFVLSGFVIAASIRARSRSGRFDLPGFTLSRMARIYPPYLLAIALCFGIGWLVRQGVLAAPASLQGWPIDLSLAAFVRALAFLYLQHDLMTRLDGPLWSLRLEVWLYAIAAGIAVAWSWRGLWRLAGAGVALVLAAGMLVGLYGASLALLTFGLGAAAALQGARIRAAIGPTPAAGAALVGLAVGVVIMSGDHALGFGRPASLAVETAAAALVALWVAHLAAGGGERLARLAPLGAYAYTLYIVHMPVIYVVRTSLSGGATPDIALAAAVFIGVQLFSAGAAAVLENHAALMGRIGLRTSPSRS